MYKQIIDYISRTALKHIAVKTVKYQSRILINAQNSNADYQFVIEDDPYMQYIKTNGNNTLSINIDIIRHCNDDEEILKSQSEALQIAMEVIAYIINDDYFKGLVSVNDYDIMGISHFTDDDSAGQRITLSLIVPSPIDLCTLHDNFDEDIDFNVPKYDDIDLDNANVCDNEGLILNPIKLPHK